MGFVIATDSRRNLGEVIYLVNPRRHFNSFWSCNKSHAQVYDTKEHAQKRLKSIKHNNPRVVPV